MQWSQICEPFFRCTVFTTVGGIKVKNSQNMLEKRPFSWARLYLLSLFYPLEMGIFWSSKENVWISKTIFSNYYFFLSTKNGVSFHFRTQEINGKAKRVFLLQQADKCGLWEGTIKDLSPKNETPEAGSRFGIIMRRRRFASSIRVKNDVRIICKDVSKCTLHYNVQWKMFRACNFLKLYYCKLRSYPR